MAVSVTLTVDPEGNLSIKCDSPQEVSRNKGKSLLSFPDQFVVVDVETTEYYYDPCIIEIGALRVKGGKVVSEFSSLVKPTDFHRTGYLSSFIVNLTGITDSMLSKAPSITTVLPTFLEFVGDSVLMAHNANFDIDCLYDATHRLLGKEFINDFVDTLRISRRVFSEHDKHTLSYLADRLGLQHLPSHRSLSDCYATLDLYLACGEKAESEGIDISKRSRKKGWKAADIVLTAETAFDRENVLYEKTCVFTGKLSRMNRKEAMQLVVNLGGKCSDRVNKETDYLVMGIQDYSRFTNGQESSKTKKAKTLLEQCVPLKIISEDDFYEMVLNVDLRKLSSSSRVVVTSS